MNIPSFIKKSIFSAIAFFGTLVVLSVGYAATFSILNPSDAGNGKTLTSTMMQTIINNLNDLNDRVFQGPAGEANISTTFSVPSGWNTNITNFTIDSAVTIGGGFTPSTGTFKPTVAGRYLFTFAAYSGGSSNWIWNIIKNNTKWAGSGGVSTSGIGVTASASYVAYLNGTTDFVNFMISNYTGSDVSISSVTVTWTKLP